MCEGAFISVVYFNINIKQEKNPAGMSWRRDWRLYDRESLCRKLSLLNWNVTSDSVQAYWDELENQLVRVIDQTQITD